MPDVYSWKVNELKIHCWVGNMIARWNRSPICRESIVWKVVKEGKPVNLTDGRQTDGYKHTLTEQIKIKAIVPLWYVDSMSQEEKRVGALIVDCGKKGEPISEEDFEYLKTVGELIGSAAGQDRPFGEIARILPEKGGHFERNGPFLSQSDCRDRRDLPSLSPISKGRIWGRRSPEGVPGSPGPGDSSAAI